MRVLLGFIVGLTLLSACSTKTESDPVFEDSASAKVTTADISRWNQAAAAIADAGPLVEQDPVFSSSPAAAIGSSEVANWNTAFSWGDHAQAGYLKTETDPKVGTLAAGDVPHWNSDGGALATGAISDLGTTVTVGTGSSALPLAVRGAQPVIQRIDQANTAGGGGSGPFTPTGTIVQTFTTGLQDSLLAVEFLMNGGSTFDVVVADLSGSPLASTRCTGANSGWTICGFPAPPPLDFNTQYQLVLTPRSASATLGVTTTNPYAGGALSGGGAPADQSWDLNFQTVVGMLQPATLLEVGTRVNVRALFHLEPQNTAPALPAEGDIYYDGVNHNLKYWNGSSWVSL